ncbi:hypothetical protein PR048_009177 [Dryococelus australis]|uniref:Uncharacterized protein n=1 Tax=Dryococelus australis TaxID=614101 RepID=A0ABQ9HZ62_9NEOP|nr:hypothetical protein PR048_009177 [Dryococelus australis]
MYELQLKTSGNEEENTKIEEEKKIDKEKSRENQSIYLLRFDLQKFLPTPLLDSGIAFYKQSLCTLDLIVYFATNKYQSAQCYIWDETIAGWSGEGGGGGGGMKKLHIVASIFYHYLKK